jgi:hypothetical protein
MSEKKLPDTFGGSDKTKQSDRQFSEKEVIKYLEEKQTNFVFLFGKTGIGKSAIVASILHYLSTNTNYYVEVLRNEDNTEGTSYLLGLRDDFRNQRFPARNPKDKAPFNLDINFFKKNNNGERDSGIPITFLEMTGEKLSVVQVPKPGMSPQEKLGATGKLHQDVDVYFKADNLSMLFIMVTTPIDARNDDILMTEFIDYISRKDSKYRDAYVFLAIAQFDRYKDKTDGLSVQKFVEKNMPNSNSRFYNKRNLYGYYTIGSVVEINENEKNKEIHIKKLDSKSPERLFSWIYETITKKELSPLSFWERLQSWFKF